MSNLLLHRRASQLPALAMVILACLLPVTGLAADRVALVIGNADYPSAPLRNPVNDARAMSRELRALGFEVISLENADKQRMEQAIVRFAGRLKEDSSGLFYYAGHGVQVNGRNYLVPVDANIDSEREVRIETVGVHLVLDELEYSDNRMNIVILDACRNNPFERRLRGGSRGLAAIDAARGTLIAYATAPGSVALDGDGSNGLYTEELLVALRQPGLQVEEVFKKVRVGVARRTNHRQIPWESSSLTGSFVFNGRAAPSTAQSAGGVDAELLFWQSVSASGSADAYRAYLRQFPQGTFTDLAQIRLAELEAADRGTVAPDVTDTPASPSAPVFDYAGTAAPATLLAKAQPAPQASAPEPPARDMPFVIAVVTPYGMVPGFCWEAVDTNAIARKASKRIQAADGFTFLHRWYQASQTRPLWRKAGLRLKPIDDKMYDYGKSAGVDAVLAIRYDADGRQCTNLDIETFLYGVAEKTRYRRQGKQKDIARMTDALVAEFAKDRAATR